MNKQPNELFLLLALCVVLALGLIGSAKRVEKLPQTGGYEVRVEVNGGRRGIADARAINNL